MANGRIAMLCPSRGRPDLLRRFYDSARHPLVDWAIYIANDDPALREYTGLGLPLHVGPPLGYPRGLSELARRMPDYSGYFSGEDDYVAIRPDWAEQYLHTMQDNNAHLVADDTEVAFWPHTAMVSPQWVRAFDGFQPDVVDHYHLTNVWAEIAAAARRGADVIERCFEHRAAPTRGGGNPNPDHAKMVAWVNAGGPATAAKLLEDQCP